MQWEYEKLECTIRHGRFASSFDRSPTSPLSLLGACRSNALCCEKRYVACDCVRVRGNFFEGFVSGSGSIPFWKMRICRFYEEGLGVEAFAIARDHPNIHRLVDQSLRTGKKYLQVIGREAGV